MSRNGNSGINNNNNNRSSSTYSSDLFVLNERCLKDATPSSAALMGRQDYHTSRGERKSICTKCSRNSKIECLQEQISYTLKLKCIAKRSWERASLVRGVVVLFQMLMFVTCLQIHNNHVLRTQSLWNG